MCFINKKERLKRKKEKCNYKCQLYEIKLKEDSYKKSLKSGKFSKNTVSFCIGFTAIFALLCLYIQAKTGYETYHLLRIVAAVFGGELLMLLFKRVYSVNDKSVSTFVNPFKKKQKNTETEQNSSLSNISGASKSNSNLNEEIEDTVRDINSSIG